MAEVITLVGGRKQGVTSAITVNGSSDVDCGSASTRRSSAYLDVSLPSLVTGTKIVASFSIEDTTEHRSDEVLYDALKVVVSNIVAGVGFRINIISLNGRVYGHYKVNWSTHGS